MQCFGCRDDYGGGGKGERTRPQAELGVGVGTRSVQGSTISLQISPSNDPTGIILLFLHKIQLY